MAYDPRVPAKKRKVVTFQDHPKSEDEGCEEDEGDEKERDDEEEEEEEDDDDDDEDVFYNAQVSEEEEILESKQASLRSKRKGLAAGDAYTKPKTKASMNMNTHSTVTPSAHDFAASSSSMLLGLECEIKQIQLDNLRKFKELQQQMQVQAKHIQDLQAENKELRAALKYQRLRWSLSLCIFYHDFIYFYSFFVSLNKS